MTSPPSPKANNMKAFSGDPNFPIWLLGDSNPARWQDYLSVPFDSRHPVRHNIWTSILDVVQEHVFLAERRRLKTADIYTRNAVIDPAIKPLGRERNWGPAVHDAIAAYRELVMQHRPRIVFTFGAFSFEFARRVDGEEGRAYGTCGAERLGVEFRERIKAFDAERTNYLPLLHRTIAGGRFRESHKKYCENKIDANYFEMQGEQIAKLLLQLKMSPSLWM